MIEKESYVLNEFEQIYNIKMEIDQNISKHATELLPLQIICWRMT